MNQPGKTLSPKWGLNGTTLICPICGAIVGFSYRGRIDEQDSRAPELTVSDILCDKCQHYIDAGFKFFIEVDSNDIRTGRVGIVNPRDAAEIFEQVESINSSQKEKSNT